MNKSYEALDLLLQWNPNLLLVNDTKQTVIDLINIETDNDLNKKKTSNL